MLINDYKHLLHNYHIIMICVALILLCDKINTNETNPDVYKDYIFNIIIEFVNDRDTEHALC